jgi:hypothetical protein
MNAPIQLLLCKTAISARDHVLAAHHAGESEYPLGHQLRMFDHVRSVADNPRRQHLALGQRDVLPNLPFVLVTGIRGFDEVSAGLNFENEIDDLLQWNVAGVRSRPTSPADVITDAIFRDAFERVVQDLDVPAEPAIVVVEAGGWDLRS